MKKILHLGGGRNASEQTNIKSNLLNLENIIKNNAYGGSTFSFFKTSSDPIQVSTSEQLQELINNGVSLITFFGHSGTGTFDFAIENPNKFTNNGKYHIVNSLGCYAGNIHSTGSSISESFVLEKEKGAVAFIASSGTAYVDPLFNYSKALYQYLGDAEKTYPLGLIVQLINEKNRLDFRNETVTLYQQLTYHGDPAIKLYKDNLPDYTFDESSIKTNENIITTNTESIDLTGRIVNLGTNIHQNITLRSELLLQDGTSFETRFDTFYMDKSEYFFKMTFNLAKEKSAGINKIVSVIDFENNIEEGPEPGAKQNNELSIFGKNGFEFFVSNNDVRPIYPKDYSIINKNNIELIASNSDLFAKPNKYYFE
ncbi:MAG TPA: C25 family cysteine peptidase, partial [Saprospiraceae bacterium]|nr:C25 family cysteine peptidase [Saprospiraceae bacterium]